MGTPRWRFIDDTCCTNLCASPGVEMDGNGWKWMDRWLDEMVRNEIEIKNIHEGDERYHERAGCVSVVREDDVKTK